jgi:hypothetical protein
LSASRAALPRTISFIYYYLPSATVATLALVYALTRRRSALLAWLSSLFHCVTTPPENDPGRNVVQRAPTCEQ